MIVIRNSQLTCDGSGMCLKQAESDRNEVIYVRNYEYFCDYECKCFMCPHCHKVNRPMVVFRSNGGCCDACLANRLSGIQINARRKRQLERKQKKQFQ